MNQGQAMVEETSGDYEVSNLTSYIFLLSPHLSKRKHEKETKNWLGISAHSLLIYSNSILKAWERNNVCSFWPFSFKNAQTYLAKRGTESSENLSNS